MISGLSDFERRASEFSQPEWDFVLGYAHFRRGRWRDAERHLALAQGKLPLLEDYALFFRASAANRIERYDQAAGLLERLLEGRRESVWTAEARVELARSLAGRKRYSEALRILKEEQAKAGRVESDRIRMLATGIRIEMGDKAGAVEEIRSLALSAGCEQDIEDLKPLIKEIKAKFGVNTEAWLASSSRQLALVRSFAAQSQWSDALVRLERLLTSTSLNAEERAEAKWLLARAYRWTHRYDESIALLRELMRDSAGRRFPALRSTMAIVYAKMSDYDNAIAIRRAMMNDAPPGSRTAADMAYRIAFLYMDSGRYDEALAHYSRVSSMRGVTPSRAALAAWYTGWCHLMKRDYPAALDAFKSLSGRRAKQAKIDDRVRYWIGRTLLFMGRRGEAERAFRELLSEYPRGYYAELAKRRLEGDSRDRKNFVAARGSWPRGGEWKPNPPDAGGSERLSRALTLQRLGLHEEVARELRALDLRRDGGSAELAMWLAGKSYAHDYAYTLAHRHFGSILRSLPGRDRFAGFVWEQAHPSAYEPVVKRLAAIEGVDPMLVWSVMRNESTFRPRVISPAGAVGLMQLMPATASRLASETGSGKGHSREDLYDPAVNIGYGISYLGKLSRLFDGDEVSMIASYNAGEEAVERWRAHGSTNDIEGWIEEIPYSETNLYVKKVLYSYWNYQRLYGRSGN